MYFDESGLRELTISGLASQTVSNFSLYRDWFDKSEYSIIPRQETPTPTQTPAAKETIIPHTPTAAPAKPTEEATFPATLEATAHTATPVPHVSPYEYTVPKLSRLTPQEATQLGSDFKSAYAEKVIERVIPIPHMPPTPTVVQHTPTRLP